MLIETGMTIVKYGAIVSVVYKTTELVVTTAALYGGYKLAGLLLL